MPSIRKSRTKAFSIRDRVWAIHHLSVDCVIADKDREHISGLSVDFTIAKAPCAHSVPVGAPRRSKIAGTPFGASYLICQQNHISRTKQSRLWTKHAAHTLLSQNNGMSLIQHDRNSSGSDHLLLRFSSRPTGIGVLATIVGVGLIAITIGSAAGHIIDNNTKNLVEIIFGAGIKLRFVSSEPRDPIMTLLFLFN